MLTVSMGVSLDGFVADRDGRFDWTAPDDELFAFHLERVSSLGGHLCGRRLFEVMRVWETDPALRATPTHAAFADVWTALPKVVFSSTLAAVPGRAARLATASLAEEAAALAATTSRDLEVGGASLAAQAIELDLVDELRLFRHPVLVGGGTPLLPPVAQTRRLELLESRTFAGGVVYERLRRVRG